MLVVIESIDSNLTSKPRDQIKWRDGMQRIKWTKDETIYPTIVWTTKKKYTNVESELPKSMI
jgi:hypothetical protein